MIVRRGSTYGVSVYDAALKRKRWVGTFETLRDAREAERNASRRRGSAARLTCREFVDLWLTNYARPAPATQRTYGYALRGFANDFGHVRLSDIDLLVARPWALVQPQSNVRAVRAMLNDAINDGLHPGPNPFANLRLEQPRAVRIWTRLRKRNCRALLATPWPCTRTTGRRFEPRSSSLPMSA
jgi:hypothetical protein